MRTAVEGARDTGGGTPTVLLETGDYEINQFLAISSGADISPADLQADLPVINLTGDGTLYPTGAGTSLSDLRIVGGTVDPGIWAPGLPGAGPLIERVEVIADNPQAACRIGSGTIRDSVCVNRGSGAGLISDAANFESSSEVKVRNVTAYASSAFGVWVVAATGSTVTFDARNLIADRADTGADIGATASDGGSVVADVDFSNYATVDETETGTGNVQIAGAGTLSNQTAPPLFVDAANNDFHQAEGSPTIDAGDGSAADLGSLDLDRSARVQGDSIDIGAYETAGPSDPDTTKPTVEITKGPPRKTRARTATFRFTASDDSGSFLLSCKLDAKEPRLCSSPTTYRNLKPGRHTFTLTGSDPAGNETTKRYVWKVVKKKRRG